MVYVNPTLTGAPLLAIHNKTCFYSKTTNTLYYLGHLSSFYKRALDKNTTDVY